MFGQMFHVLLVSRQWGLGWLCYGVLMTWALQGAHAAPLRRSIELSAAAAEFQPNDRRPAADAAAAAASALGAAREPAETSTLNPSPGGLPNGTAAHEAVNGTSDTDSEASGAGKLSVAKAVARLESGRDAGLLNGSLPNGLSAPAKGDAKGAAAKAHNKKTADSGAAAVADAPLLVQANGQ
jgi:hypothetical protein